MKQTSLFNTKIQSPFCSVLFNQKTEYRPMFDVHIQNKLLKRTLVGGRVLTKTPVLPSKTGNVSSRRYSPPDITARYRNHILACSLSVVCFCLCFSLLFLFVYLFFCYLLFCLFVGFGFFFVFFLLLLFLVYYNSFFFFFFWGGCYFLMNIRAWDVWLRKTSWLLLDISWAFHHCVIDPVRTTIYLFT